MTTALQQIQILTPPLKCFASLGFNGRRHGHSAAVRTLQHAVWQAPIDGSSERLESFARVIPLLICGEQSAINVFRQAANARLSRDVAALLAAFYRIEMEEAGHELLWQSLTRQLPTPSDRQHLRRRAAIFFAKLGRADTMADHFAQVSQLDSAVGTIMWHLEHSDIATDQRVKRIAAHIKREEAHHVAVSKKFALAMGTSRKKYLELGAKIRHDLIELLAPIADSIEGIGIDADLMFRKIAKD